MDPMEVVRTNEDQFNDRSFREKAEQLTDASIIVVDAPADRELQGVEGYKQYREGYIAALPDIRGGIVDLKVSGNNVTATVRRTGTFTGEMRTADGAIPGNGLAFWAGLERCIRQRCPSIWPLLHGDEYGVGRYCPTMAVQAKWQDD